MSAGKFLKTKYQASYGAGTAIHPIVTSPATVFIDFGAGSNNEPTEAINNPISAILGLGSNAVGLRPRYVTVSLLEGADPPPGYLMTTSSKIVILRESLWEDIVVGEIIIYRDTSYTVLSKSQEIAQ